MTRAMVGDAARDPGMDRTSAGAEPAPAAERVMVCVSSSALAPRVIRAGARLAGRLGAAWFAVYVETPGERPGRIDAEQAEVLRRNIALADSLGASVVRVKAGSSSEGLVAFARREGITHVVLGETARARWELVWRGSTIHRLASSIRDAAVHVVPFE